MRAVAPLSASVRTRGIRGWREVEAREVKFLDVEVVYVQVVGLSSGESKVESGQWDEKESERE